MKALGGELATLLDWLCHNWGFCIPPAEKLRISGSKRCEAREFAIEVLRAEGFDAPDSELEWIRRLKARFIEHFGSEVVSVDDYES